MKLKKYITLIIITIFIILGFGTLSNARTISWTDYLKDSNLYCLQSTQTLRVTPQLYILKNTVRIVGTKATDAYNREHSSQLNAKLAYMLATFPERRGSRYTDGKDAEYNKPGVKERVVLNGSAEVVKYSDEQIGFWRYINSWIRNLNGTLHDLDMGIVDPANASKGDGETIYEKNGNVYAAECGEGKIINNKPGAKTAEKQGDKYKIGPFNYTFPGEFDKNATPTDYRTGLLVVGENSKGEGTQINIGNTNNYDPITSGNDFYIYVPESSGITKVTRVYFRAKKNVYDVTAKFWYNPSGYQSVLELIEKKIVEERYEDISEYNIPLTGGLNINKRETNTEKQLAGATFTIQITSGPAGYNGKYVNARTGNVTNSNYVTNAYPIPTNAQGEISLSNLIPGTYRIEEVSAPAGYQKQTTAQVVEVGSNRTSGVVFYNSKTAVDVKYTAELKKVIKEDDTQKGIEGVSFDVWTLPPVDIRNPVTQRLKAPIKPTLRPEPIAPIEPKTPISVPSAPYAPYASKPYLPQKPTEAQKAEYDIKYEAYIKYTEYIAYQKYLSAYRYWRDTAHPAWVRNYNNWENVIHPAWVRDKWTYDNIQVPEYNRLMKIWNDFMPYYQESIGIRTNSAGKIDMSKFVVRSSKYPTTCYQERSAVSKYFDIDTNIYTRNIQNEAKIIFENERKRVDIRGYVWEDGIGIGKNQYRNNLFDGVGKDAGLLGGISVYYKNGNTIIATTTTIENGTYSFVGVPAWALTKANRANTYIEFHYNGMKYQSVVPYVNIPNGSKATENDRVGFNNRFSVTSTNEGVRTLGKSPNNGTVVDYTNSKYKSEFKYDTPENYGGKYRIERTTTQNSGYTGISTYNPLKDEISDINLGVYSREMPDIAISNDISEVKIVINGKEYVYKYGSKQLEGGNTLFDVAVKFDGKYGNLSYTREVYPSDINTNLGDKDLKIYVKYKTEITNESTSVWTESTEIVSYYDEKYSEISGSSSNISWSNRSAYRNAKTTSGYKEAFGKIRQRIAPQTKISIETEYLLKRETAQKVFQGENELTAYNIVEINGYTSYIDGGSSSTYAGIDKDSAAGNSVIGNKDTYEDDTDYAPTFILKKSRNDRQVDGVIFEDMIIKVKNEENLSGKIKIGDGIYKAEDQLLTNTNVEVSLVEKNTGRIASTITTRTGIYSLKSFVPGDYYVRFKWGDGKYYVQDYKSTIYVDQNRYTSCSNTSNITNRRWYLNSTLSPTNYSDAIDNMEKRYDIDEKMKIINNMNNHTNKDANLKMESETPMMEVGIENETNDKGEGTEARVFEIKGIDFGIVKRPEMRVELEKRIEKVKITLANGLILVDATVDEYGKLTGSITNIKYLPPNATIQEIGAIYAELDQELIHGANIEIKYKYTIRNTSDKDYIITRNNAIDKNLFYRYGTKIEEEVVMKTNMIVDYLDKEMSKASKEGIRDEKEQKENEQWSIEDTKNDNNYQGGLLEYTKNYSTENANKRKKDFEKTSKKYNIFSNGMLRNELIRAGEEISTTFISSKVLANTAEELNFGNSGEIVEIEKTGGGYIEEIVPFNYIPTHQIPIIENDTAIAEETIITPPTGQNNNERTIYIVVVAVSLTLFGVGVIIIIKKVGFKN